MWFFWRWPSFRFLKLQPSVSFACGCFAFLLSVSTSLAHPGVGIVQDSQGNIYYSDLTQVWQVSSDGKSKRVVVSDVHTHELYLDDQNCLYGEHLWYNGEKLNTWGSFAWVYDLNTGQFTNLSGPVEGFNHGHSYCRDQAHNMYWVERGEPRSSIKRKTIAGQIETLFEQAFVDVRWQYSTLDGTFYFIDDNDLYKLTPERALILVKENVDGVLKRPADLKNNHSIFGIFDDTQGNVYCAVLSKNQIRKITPQGEMFSIYSSAPGWEPTGGLIDRHHHLWVLENQTKTNKVRITKVLADKLNPQLLSPSN